MSSINWIPQLQPNEYPVGVVDDMEHDLFNKALIPLRQRTNVPFTPSPLVEGHVRNGLSGSRHSLNHGKRKSDATDTFIPSTQTAVGKVFKEAQRISIIGGIGLYFDTRPSVMFHIDLRRERLLWLRVDGEYIYEVNDPQRFYSVLAEQLDKLEK